MIARRIPLSLFLSLGLYSWCHSAPISGTILVEQIGGGNAPSDIALELSSATSPGVVINHEASNRGDFWLTFTNINAVAEGALISTVAENGRDQTAFGSTGGSIFATNSVLPIPASGEYVVSTHRLGSNEEYNLNAAFAWFPFDEYLAGVATGPGDEPPLTVLQASDGIALGVQVIPSGVGLTTIDLRTMGASSENGILLASAAENDDNFALVEAREDGTFSISVRDNNSNAPDPLEQGAISFAYIPFAEVGLPGQTIVAAARVRENAASPEGAGGYMMMKGPAGQWYLTIPGHNPDTGTLLLTPAGGGTNNVDNVLSYHWDVAERCWVIESRDLPNGVLQDGADEDMFNFAFLAREPVEVVDSPPLIDEFFVREIRPHGDSLIGNGIDTATGAFEQGRELLSIEALRPLTFDIVYNSRQTSIAGPVGPSWSHNYEARLEGTYGHDVIVHWDAHRYSRFRYLEMPAEGNLHYEGLDDDVRFASLYTQVPHPALPPGNWKLTLEDGSTYFFGKDGRLVAEQNIVDQTIELAHDEAGRLIAIEEPYSGAQIELAYNDRNLVETISDQLGRTVTLTYDENARLLTIPVPFLPEEISYDSGIGATAIPDGNPAGRIIPLSVPDGGSIGGVQIRALRVDHSRPSDLAVTLISPGGTELPLPTETTDGPTVIDLAGRFFAGFEAEDRMGEWQLKVVDSVAGGTGAVHSFELSFSESTRAVHYTYDSANRIISATDALGDQLLAAEYDSQGRIIRQSDGRPETPDATVVYEAVNGTNHTRSTYTDPIGQNWSFIHDARFSLLSATDPLGNSATFTYDKNGQRLTATDAKGRVTTFTYSGRGDVATYTDPAGHTTSFTYDFDHNIVEIVDALGRETSMLRMNGRLTVVTDELGHRDQKRYFANGQIQELELEDGGKVEYELTPSGQLASASNPEDSSAKQNAAYDLAGRVILSTDYEGNETHLTYTPSNELRRKTDPEGNASWRDYDHRGRMIRQVDERNFATTYTYDGNGNILTATNALGEFTAYTYDADDRLLTSTDARGATTTYEYDALGRTVAVTDPIGRVTRTEYDAVGNISATYNKSGALALAITYDERDLPVSMVDALGHRVSATYDALRRKTHTTDALGRVTTYEYDELDRLVKTTDPLGRVGTTEYFPDDVVSYFTPPGSSRVRLVANKGNHITHVSNNDGSSQSFQYNARNQLSYVVASGVNPRMIAYTYDSLGRLRESIPQNAPDANRGYTYDAAGNLTTISTFTFREWTPQIHRTYDPLGRLATYTNNRGETLVYIYDAANNLAGLIYPDGSEVNYEYDAVNRLISVIDWADRETVFTWDDQDHVTRIEFPNGTRRELSYDAAGNLRVRRDLAADGEVILSYLYQYDAVGQLQAEQLEPTLEPAIPTPATYTTDSQGRVRSYNGEVLSVNDDGQLTLGPDGTHLESLDWNRRNKLYRTSGYFHFYDHEDQLVGWEPRGGEIEDGAHFFVNPAAGRSQTLTKSGPDAESKRYVYGVGLLYEEDANSGEIRVFHYDQRGSAVAFSGSDGMVTGRVGYTPYGQIAHREGDTDTIFSYNALFGVLTSPEGINYMRFRWYSPELRRFLSRDARLGSIASLSSMNRYAYAGGNPVMRVDPDGEVWWIAAGAAIGAVVNVGATLAVDFIEDGKIDSGFNEIAAAAVSGAISGGIFAATGGIGGAVIGGALGGAAENLVLAGLRGEEINAEELAMDTLIGGAAGAAGHGAGKLASKGGAKIYSKTFGKPGRFAKFANKMTVPDKISRRRAVGSFNQLLVRSGKKTGSNSAMSFLGAVSGGLASGVVFGDSLGGGGHTPQVKDAGGIGDFRKVERALRSLNAGRVGTYGEHVHFDLYLDAVRMADRPVPSHPNNTLTGF